MNISIWIVTITLAVLLAFNTNAQVVDPLFEKNIVKSEFGFIKDMDVDDEGRLYIYDFFLGLISVDFEGNMINSFNSKGRGPGEYESIADILVIDGNKILIIDDNLFRATILDSSLNYIISFQLPFVNSENGSRMLPSKVWEIAGGKYIVEYIEAYHKGTVQEKRQKKYLLLNNSFEVVDSELHTTRDDQMLIIKNGDDFLVSILPFGRKSIIDFFNDGTWVEAWTGEPCLLLKQEKICLELQEHKISKETLEKIYDSEDGELFKKTELSSSYPFFEDLHISDDEEFLWLTRRVNSDTTEILKFSVNSKEIVWKSVLHNKFKLFSLYGKYIYGINFPVYGYEIPIPKKYLLEIDN